MELVAPEKESWVKAFYRELKNYGVDPEKMPRDQIGSNGEKLTVVGKLPIPMEQNASGGKEWCLQKKGIGSYITKLYSTLPEKDGILLTKWTIDGNIITDKNGEHVLVDVLESYNNDIEKATKEITDMLYDKIHNNHDVTFIQYIRNRLIIAKSNIELARSKSSMKTFLPKKPEKILFRFSLDNSLSKRTKPLFGKNCGVEQCQR